MESGDFELTWGAATAHLDPDDVSPCFAVAGGFALAVGAWMLHGPGRGSAA